MGEGWSEGRVRVGVMVSVSTRGPPIVEDAEVGPSYPTCVVLGLGLGLGSTPTLTLTLALVLTVTLTLPLPLTPTTVLLSHARRASSR